MMKQAKEASQRPHIIVATPGRLADLITSSSDCIHFRKLRYLVLDEADRLLEATFSEHLNTIFQFIEANDKIRPQILLFSATLTRDLAIMLQESPSETGSSDKIESNTCRKSSLVISDFLKLKDPFVFHASEE